MTFDPLKTYFGKYQFWSEEQNTIPNDVLTAAFHEMEKIIPENSREEVVWEYSNAHTGVTIDLHPEHKTIRDGWRRPAYIKWKFQQVGEKGG